MQELLKTHGVSAVLAALLLGGGTMNTLSEGREDIALEQLEAELREIDVSQDGKYDDLLQMYNDLNTEFTVITYRLDQLEQ